MLASVHVHLHVISAAKRVSAKMSRKDGQDVTLFIIGSGQRAVYLQNDIIKAAHIVKNSIEKAKTSMLLPLS